MVMNFITWANYWSGQSWTGRTSHCALVITPLTFSLGVRKKANAGEALEVFKCSVQKVGVVRGVGNLGPLTDIGISLVFLYLLLFNIHLHKKY